MTMLFKNGFDLVFFDYLSPLYWTRGLCPTILAGVPIAIALSGMSLVTTDPAPINAFSPIATHGVIVVPAPMDSSLFTRVWRSFHSPCDLGCSTFVNVTFGA